MPSEAELRVSQAQFVGWLEGLFHGIQTTLFAQQMARARNSSRCVGPCPPAWCHPARTRGRSSRPGSGPYL